MTTTTTRDPVEGVVPLDEAARRLATNGTEWEDAYAVLTTTYPASTRDEIIEAWAAAERAHATTTTVQQQLDDLTERDDPARKLIRKGLLWPVVRLLIVDLAQPEPVVRAWLDNMKDATEAKKVKEAEWARVDEHVARAVALREERERQQHDADTAPPPEPVEVGDPAELLDEIEAFIRQYLVLPNDEAYVATVLWAAHTHFIENLDESGRLAFLSPEPGSGKSRALELLAFLVREPMPTLQASTAVLYRRIARLQCTVLQDETDTIWGYRAKGNPDAEPLRRLFNGGYRRGQPIYRMGGENMDEELEFDPFSPVAFAGLENLPDTLVTRTVIIRMRKKTRDEHVDRFRYSEVREQARPLRDRLSAWAASVSKDQLQRFKQVYAGKVLPFEGGCDPLPDAIDPGRDEEAWEPLHLVADLAGGHWPDRVRATATWFLENRPEDATPIHQQLVCDIKSIWEEGRQAMLTRDIVSRLVNLDDGPWESMGESGLTAKTLAFLLKTNYQIPSGRNVRTPEGVGKGYRLDELADTFRRSAPHVEHGSALDTTTTAASVPPPSGRYVNGLWEADDE